MTRADDLYKSLSADKRDKLLGIQLAASILLDKLKAMPDSHEKTVAVTLLEECVRSATGCILTNRETPPKPLNKAQPRMPWWRPDKGQGT